MRTFPYTFANDFTVVVHEPLTREQLDYYESFHGECVFNGFRDNLESIQLLRANSHSRGDGFKPGWHPALGMEIRSNEQYQRVLKEKGMVEVGNEKQKDAKPARKGLGEEFVKEAIKQGAELSGQECAKLAGEIA